MPKKVTTQSPKLFIGIDIHKKSWKVHFTTDITVGSGRTMPPSSDVLKNYVNKYYRTHHVCIAYEAGCCGYCAARQFETYGWDTYVINPADVPRPAKNAIIKTDKIDAENIAKQLRAGNLKKLVIPDVERECLRSLTRQRTSLVKDMRRIKSRVKSLLLYYDVEVPTIYDNPNWSKPFIHWLNNFKWNYSTIDRTLKSMMSQYGYIDIQLRMVSIEIRAYCKKHYKRDYSLLRSIPGIGPLTSAYIISEIGDINRFSSFKKFAGYVGIIPGIYSSGENARTLGVTPRANRTIRSLIVEASWVAIRIDPVLQSYFRKHAGNNTKAAIFKVARKLLSRIYAVVKTEIPYEIGVIS